MERPLNTRSYFQTLTYSLLRELSKWPSRNLDHFGWFLVELFNMVMRGMFGYSTTVQTQATDCTLSSTFLEGLIRQDAILPLWWPAHEVISVAQQLVLLSLDLQVTIVNAREGRRYDSVHRTRGTHDADGSEKDLEQLSERFRLGISPSRESLPTDGDAIPRREIGRPAGKASTSKENAADAGTYQTQSFRAWRLSAPDCRSWVWMASSSASSRIPRDTMSLVVTPSVQVSNNTAFHSAVDIRARCSFSLRNSGGRGEKPPSEKRATATVTAETPPPPFPH
ncbi:hypothetical protein OIDMADRAFT_145588 [Oidiodendron maius Zn]|uniref:Uncharacterized protein n=1 Tax=Oidiodendron maius (strain Zn) TaxID=913774 RepID=A0A0C3HGM9_OIDMZ|nr:hypothetical protein OIDMADRAFT_145588 [Oidiodendron maius Zn]